MQKEYRIRKNGQFQYVYRKGSAAGAKEMTLLYIKAPRLQVGFSVSKKVGIAVVRNRVKRRLRAAFRSSLICRCSACKRSESTAYSKIFNGSALIKFN